MTVTAFKKRKLIIKNRKKKEKPFVFVFENSNILLEGLMFLHRNKMLHIKSSLYSFKNLYCLIIFSKYEKHYFLHLKEYCLPITNPPYFTDYIKEYGKPLITFDAIKKLGDIFFKGI